MSYRPTTQQTDSTVQRILMINHELHSMRETIERMITVTDKLWQDRCNQITEEENQQLIEARKQHG